MSSFFYVVGVVFTVLSVALAMGAMLVLVIRCWWRGLRDARAWVDITTALKEYDERQKQQQGGDRG